MGRSFHPAQGVREPIEGKYLIYRGFQEMLGYGAIHLLEIGARSHIDTPQIDLLVEDEGNFDRTGGLGEHADLGNNASDAHGAQRAGKCSGATDFDD